MSSAKTEVSEMTRAELTAREKIIEHGKRAFVEVGNALADIRDRRGYKLAGHKTFESYCQERWGWNVRNASYYIGAAQVAEEIGTQVPNLELTQARELARLISPFGNGDGRRKEIDMQAVREVAAGIDFSRATVNEVARAVDAKLSEQRNSSVTYHAQPGIHATRGAVPLAGTSHLYTVEKLLWPEAVEEHLAGLLIGHSLHLCAGKSKLGDVRLDLHEDDTTIRADAARLPFAEKSFDTLLCDPPYNGEMQWNHDLLSEMARVAAQRIVFQHWFLACNPNGFYKKAQYFKLTCLYVWAPKTYFGRVNTIQVYDA